MPRFIGNGRWLRTRALSRDVRRGGIVFDSICQDFRGHTGFFADSGTNKHTNNACSDYV